MLSTTTGVFRLSWPFPITACEPLLSSPPSAHKSHRRKLVREVKGSSESGATPEEGETYMGMGMGHSLEPYPRM